MLYRPFHLKSPNEIQAVLMRNIREELCDIPKTLIQTVVFDKDTPIKMTLSIPDRVEHEGKTITYPLYDQIKGKMVIKVLFNQQPFKFQIDDNFTVKETKTMKTKTITAYSYEKTLEKKTFQIGKGATRQLYCPASETVETEPGILNWFEAETAWKVGTVTEQARKELSLFNEVHESLLVENFVNPHVQVGQVIWEQAVQIPKNQGFSLAYEGVKTYSGENLLKTENITHSFDEMKKDITHIKASYSSDVDYRFGVLYEFTHSDQTTTTLKLGFTNVKDLKIEIESLRLLIQTGEIVEQWTTKYRYFDQLSTTWYTFLLNEVSEAFGVVFVFDSANQLLHCYSEEEFGTDTGLHLSFENGVKTVNKTHKSGEIVTRLWVNSQNCTILEENKLGTNYVEDFSYFQRMGLMSEELQQALERYDVFTDSKQADWLGLRNAKNKVDQTITLKSSDLKSLEERYKYESSILSAYIKANNTDPKQEEQAELVAQLDRDIQKAQADLQALKDESDELMLQMNEIGKQISKENAEDDEGKIFTALDLVELEEFTIEGEWTDEYYTTPLGLYRKSLEVVKDSNAVPIDFTIETENFLNRIVHPNGWPSVIRIGEKLTIDDEELVDDEGFIQLTGFTYTPNDESINSLKFTNNKKPMSDIKTISDIGRTQNYLTNMTNYYKSVWQSTSENNVAVSKLIDEGLDLAAQLVRGKSTTNRIQISETGIYIIDATNDHNQLYIGSGLIAITQNRWSTSKLAITAEGVSAEILAGKILLGDALYIGNEQDTFVIRPNGLSIYDQASSQEERIFLGLEKVNGVMKARLRLHSANDSNRLVLSEDGIYQIVPYSGCDNFDLNNHFFLNFYVGDNISRIDSFNVRVKLSRFRGYTKGASSTPSTTTVQTTKENMVVSSVETSEATIIPSVSTATESPYSDPSQYPAIGTSTPQRGPSTPSDISGTPYEYHTHSINPALIYGHTHPIKLEFQPHSHKFNLSTLPHTHTLDVLVEAHTHNLEYGIFEFPIDPVVDIYLDSMPVALKVSGGIELDLKSKLTLTKGWHTIQVVGKYSNENQLGLGRCQVDAQLGAFVSF